MNNLNIPKTAANAINRLKEGGYDAYLVGGCVRDLVMGLDHGDLDICTSARPEEIKMAFSDCKTIDTGIKHGTVTVLADDTPIEITTFRSERDYSDSRHPDSVSFIKSLDEDVRRRDFTINALACDENGGIIDICGGLEDIRQGLIRCVGDPDERFREDALRIMRAVRFSSRLGFKIEDKTREAMLRNLPGLQKISKERILSELKGILCGDGAGRVMREYPEVFFEVIPELRPMWKFDQHNRHHCYDVWEHTAYAVDGVPKDPLLRMTMLLHDIGKPKSFFIGDDGTGRFLKHPIYGRDISDEVLRRMGCDNDSRELIVSLVEAHDLRPTLSRNFARRCLNKWGREKMRLLFIVVRADICAQSEWKKAEKLQTLKSFEDIVRSVIEEMDCVSLSDLAVNGDDLISLGYREGAEIGETLNELLSMVMDDELPNEKNALLEYAGKRVCVSKD